MVAPLLGWFLASLWVASIALSAQAATNQPIAIQREVPIVTPGNDLQHSRVVTGAPYCADAVHETTQWRIDPSTGAPNTMVRKSSARICRDSEGRTRQEMDGAGHKQVLLRDPVAKESWMLDPEHKTAIRLGDLPPRAPMVDDGPSPVRVTGNETVSPDGKRREVVMALPAKDIEGVTANGERTTWTIEAGKIGNEKAIVQIREVWTSPELMLTIYSRDVDPRSGETVYRLSNLKRGEPDAAQFKVPAGYEITEPNMVPRGLKIIKEKTPATTAPAATGKG